MAEGDDYNLDLSYMDENNAEGQQHQDGDYQYDDSAELYGDESYSGDHGDAPHDTNGDAAAKAESVDTLQGDVKTEQGADTEPGSRKRKERDDDDEYSQTAQNMTPQNMTPRQTSSTPVPSQHGGYGPQPTHALNIQQLGHNMSEETIREWANAVGKEGEIEELKFDEFKPNGKSKGACFVRFKTPEAAQLVKDYVTNTVPKPPGKPAGYIVHYANSNPYLRSGNNPGPGTSRPNNRGGMGGNDFRGGRGNFRGNFNRGGGYGGRGSFNNNNNNMSMPNMNQGGWNNQGGMNMGGGFSNMGGGGFNNRGGMNNRGRGPMAGNMGRGGGMNMGMNQGGIMGGMGRSGMPGMPPMPMMNPMMGMPGMFNMPNMMGGMQNRGGMMGGNMMGGRAGFPGGQQGGMNKRPRMG